MKSNIFTILRFVLALLTVAAILGKPYLPQKRLLLHPSPQTYAYLYGNTDDKGYRNYGWIDPNTQRWWCRHGALSDPCGVAMGRDGNGTARLAVAQVHPDCQYIDTDEDGDGWGWENEKSCEVTQATRIAGLRLNPAPVCRDALSDEDGDGWGWENNQSCTVPGFSPAVIEPRDNSRPAPVCRDARSDPDGDGWGWENEMSCEVQPKDAIALKPRKKESTVASSTKQTSQTLSSEAINFAAYDGVNIEIDYEGKANYLRFYLRQDTKGETSLAESDPGKFMSVYLHTEDLKAGPAYIDLAEFSVAEWWVMHTNAPRNLALPQFDRIIGVGLDHVEVGMHKLAIQKIELVGEYISTKAFLLALLAFWVMFLSAEGVARYLSLRSASRAREAQITHLSTAAAQLENENQQLETRAVTDALTRVYNREGIKQYLRALYGGEYLPSDFGVLVLDLDHFKKINDEHGHDAGDRVLEALARVVGSNIREGDIFARWGGEEFVLLARDTGNESLLQFGEKLRQIIAVEMMDAELGLYLTVSIGIAKVRRGETFADTFKRADVALYEAKRSRNCVVYEP